MRRGRSYRIVSYRIVTVRTDSEDNQPIVRCGKTHQRAFKLYYRRFVLKTNTYMCRQTYKKAVGILLYNEVYAIHTYVLRTVKRQTRPFNTTWLHKPLSCVPDIGRDPEYDAKVGYARPGVTVRRPSVHRTPSPRRPRPSPLIQTRGPSTF
jgi:hypothetical protein